MEFEVGVARSLRSNEWEDTVRRGITCFHLLFTRVELSGISCQDMLGVCTLETPVFNNRNDLLVIVLLKFKGGEMIVFSALDIIQS